MLQITIPEKEFWDEKKREFLYTEEKTLCLEHSLVSLSKWESKWEKPFLNDEEKTVEETLDYIRCMTITQNVNPLIYYAIDNNIIEQVKKYIDKPMTATWFDESNKRKGLNSEVTTSELIYYWMVSYQIPFECQKWHLNRLLTLIRVCNEKNKPPKKKSIREIASNYAALNKARREKWKSKG